MEEEEEEDDEGVDEDEGGQEEAEAETKASWSNTPLYGKSSLPVITKCSRMWVIPSSCRQRGGLSRASVATHAKPVTRGPGTWASITRRPVRSEMYTSTGTRCSASKAVRRRHRPRPVQKGGKEGTKKWERRKVEFVRLPKS